MAIILLFFGGFFGVICYKNIIEFRNLFGSKADNELENDALENYLKINKLNYSTDTIQLLRAWRSANDAKEKNKLMKQISLLVNTKIIDVKPLDERSESAYLNIIGGLLVVMHDKSLTENQKALFGNQAAIIQTLLNKFDGVYGISQTNLDTKFAKANQSIKSK